MGYHIDGLKFAGGSFSMMPEERVRELIDLAHENEVYVSTGGWMEHILTQPDSYTMVEKYLKKCKDLGFDVIEISSSRRSGMPNTCWFWRRSRQPVRTDFVQVYQPSLRTT
jgi:phosphosulfolactate synthase (CoM biosynthesis protein A)